MLELRSLAKDDQKRRLHAEWRRHQGQTGSININVLVNGFPERVMITRRLHRTPGGWQLPLLSCRS